MLSLFYDGGVHCFIVRIIRAFDGERISFKPMREGGVVVLGDLFKHESVGRWV